MGVCVSLGVRKGVPRIHDSACLHNEILRKSTIVIGTSVIIVLTITVKGT